MKFSVFKEEFKKNFIQVAKTIDKKKMSNNILESIYIEAKDDSIVMKSTDLEISSIVTQSAMIEEEGVICIDARIGMEILNSISWNKSDSFEFWTEDNRVIIQCGKASAKMAMRDPEDFPLFSPVQEGNTFRMDFSNFHEAIKAVKASISRDVLKENIRGVFIEPESENSFNFVSTDTHRLSWKKIPVLSSSFEGNPKSIIIPLVAIETLGGISSAEAMEMKAIYNDDNISFYLDNLIITASLIKGEFPDYKKVVPAQFNLVLKVKKSDFQNSLKAVFPFSKSARQNESSGVELRINQERILFFASNPELGSAQQELYLEEGDLEGNLEEEFLIKFNIKYLLDAIGPVEGEKIELKLINSSAQALFKDEERDDYFAIVMPMKIM